MDENKILLLPNKRSVIYKDNIYSLRFDEEVSRDKTWRCDYRHCTSSVITTGESNCLRLKCEKHFPHVHQPQVTASQAAPEAVAVKQNKEVHNAAPKDNTLKIRTPKGTKKTQAKWKSITAERGKGVYTSTFGCKLCQERFPSLALRDAHEETSHSSFCKICEYKFPSTADMIQHCRVQHHVQPKVKQTVETKSNGTTTKTVITTNYEYSSKSPRTKSCKSYEPDKVTKLFRVQRYSCSLCSSYFRRGERDSHNHKRHDGFASFTRFSAYKCPECDRSMTKKKLKEHLCAHEAKRQEAKSKSKPKPLTKPRTKACSVVLERMRKMSTDDGGRKDVERDKDESDRDKDLIDRDEDESDRDKELTDRDKDLTDRDESDRDKELTDRDEDESDRDKELNDRDEDESDRDKNESDRNKYDGHRRNKLAETVSRPTNVAKFTKPKLPEQKRTDKSKQTDGSLINLPASKKLLREDSDSSTGPVAKRRKPSEDLDTEIETGKTNGWNSKTQQPQNTPQQPQPPQQRPTTVSLKRQQSSTLADKIEKKPLKIESRIEDRKTSFAMKSESKDETGPPSPASTCAYDMQSSTDGQMDEYTTDSVVDSFNSTKDTKPFQSEEEDRPPSPASTVDFETEPPPIPPMSDTRGPVGESTIDQFPPPPSPAETCAYLNDRQTEDEVNTESAESITDSLSPFKPENGVGKVASTTEPQTQDDSFQIVSEPPKQSSVSVTPQMVTDFSSIGALMQMSQTQSSQPIHEVVQLAQQFISQQFIQQKVQQAQQIVQYLTQQQLDPVMEQLLLQQHVQALQPETSSLQLAQALFQPQALNLIPTEQPTQPMAQPQRQPPSQHPVKPQSLSTSLALNSSSAEANKSCCYPDCDFIFVSAGDSKAGDFKVQHYRRHFNDEPDLRVCPKCFQKFSSSREVEEHFLTVHGGISRRRCEREGCGRSFWLAETLNNHRRVAHE